MLVLYIRRLPLVSGGELGGPKRMKILSTAFFLLLWFIFVIFSALEAYKIIDPNF
jgi:solute carrier family 8 (sodium/calcium exchanger)